jgi:hypothetical protein
LIHNRGGHNDFHELRKRVQPNQYRIAKINTPDPVSVRQTVPTGSRHCFTSFVVNHFLAKKVQFTLFNTYSNKDKFVNKDSLQIETNCLMKILMQPEWEGEFLWKTFMDGTA